jgi:hypothetical protein
MKNYALGVTRVPMKAKTLVTHAPPNLCILRGKVLSKKVGGARDLF